MLLNVLAIMLNIFIRKHLAITVLDDCQLNDENGRNRSDLRFSCDVEHIPFEIDIKKQLGKNNYAICSHDNPFAKLANLIKVPI